MNFNSIKYFNRSKNIHIALWGARTLDNWGDRLIPQITEKELAQALPSATFHHFCPWSNGRGTSPLYIDNEGKWSSNGKYDAIIVVGGGLLGGPPFKHPVMQIFCFGKDPKNFDPGTFIGWNAIGLQDGCIEPIVPHWRIYLESVCRRLNYCTVRSKDTSDLIASNTSISTPLVVPDPVFALPPLEMKPRQEHGKYRLGVAIGSPFVSSEFLSVIARPDLVDRCPFNSEICLSREEVYLYDFSTSEQIRKKHFVLSILEVLKSLSDNILVEFFGFGRMYGDEQLAKQFASLCPRSRLVYVKDNDINTIQSLISSYDGLLLSRFHSVILALRAGKPFVVADPYWSPLNGTSKLHQLMISINREYSYWTYGTKRELGSDELRTAISNIFQDAINKTIYYDLNRQCKRNFENLSSNLIKYVTG